MLHKLIFVISLIAIFVCEFLGIKHYLQRCHKGRLIDSIIAILLIVVFIVIISVFVYVYNKFVDIY